MVECSACLKEVPLEEFRENGGLCKECGGEVDRLLKEGGQEAVRKFWRKKREEWAART